MRRRFLAPVVAVLAMGASASAQQAALYDDPADTRHALSEAKAQADAARTRAERLEADSAGATQSADRTAAQAAAIAARVQQAEAEIAGDEARIHQIERQRAALRSRLSQKQRPLMRLTGALQRLSRRPLVVSLLHPGSVRDNMHLRALIETMMPEVRRRTVALRAEIARGQALQTQLATARGQLSNQRATLDGQRRKLADLEFRQRLAARTVTGSADRESELALTLAEHARDLGQLVGEMDKAAALREQLAALPGPVLRPAQPDHADLPTPGPAPTEAARLDGYVLPVTGRLVAGFGVGGGASATRGLSILAQPQAQVVAPGAGHVGFAGPYPGFGQIVIIDHGNGWTSLVTGMAQVSVSVGQVLVAGAPLGTAPAGKPVLSLELRHDGVPVNPLDQIAR